MTTQEAKRILTLHRPGSADAKSPEFAEALALAQRDPELKQWLEDFNAVDGIIRDRFKQIPVPAGLKAQILAQHKTRAKVIWWQQPAVLAAAAAFVLLIGIAALMLPSRPSDAAEATFQTFRKRMVSQVLRSYAMTLESPDAAQIRAHLIEQHAPADYVLPDSLAARPLVGCGVLSWQATNAAMICFRTGKPLAPGEKSDLFLFVVDRGSVAQAPVAGKSPPQFAQVKKLATASWSVGNKTYMLATPGDEKAIREYF